MTHPDPPPDSRGLLVVNAGSSSVKFALYEATGLRPVAGGQATGLSAAASESRFTADLEAGRAGGEAAVDEALPAGSDHATALARALDWLAAVPGLPALAAAGHRVVHGGGVYDRPQRVDDALIAALEEFAPYAPRHQPHNVAGIRALRRAAPELPQVACFDTAFHAAMPAGRTRLPIPRRHHEAGVRRYGFHGLSYQSIVDRFPEIVGEALPARTAIAHLGAGASLAGVREGVGVYTTMGFSPLDGLVMATRPGRLDPGVLLHLMRSEGMGVEALETMLYDESGLAGLSGSGGDMKALLDAESEDPDAALAVAHYVDRLAQEVAAAAAALDGLDALVFTGGVGENAAAVRARVLTRLAWLGFRLDQAANEVGAARLTVASSAPAAYRVPTDEQETIARACRDLLAEDGRGG